MSESPTRTQFPGTTKLAPSSPNQVASNQKDAFYEAGGLLRLLSTEEIYEDDRMEAAVNELKNKDVGELRQQLADAGATPQLLIKVDDLRATTRKAAILKLIIPLAREQNTVYLHLVLQPPSVLRMHGETVGIKSADITDMLFQDDNDNKLDLVKFLLEHKPSLKMRQVCARELAAKNKQATADVADKENAPAGGGNPTPPADTMFNTLQFKVGQQILRQNCLFTVESIEVNAETKEVKVHARHANGKTLVKDAAEFMPVKADFESPKKRATPLKAGDKALLRGALVIVKETDSAGLVTVFYEGFPKKTAVIQEADLTRLKRRKIFVAESEDDDDDSDDDNDGEEDKSELQKLVDAAGDKLREEDGTVPTHEATENLRKIAAQTIAFEAALGITLTKEQRLHAIKELRTPGKEGVNTKKVNSALDGLVLDVGAGASPTIADFLKGAKESTVQGKIRNIPLLSRDPYSPPPPEFSGAHPRVTQDDMADGFKNMVLPLFFVFPEGESHIDRMWKQSLSGIFSTSSSVEGLLKQLLKAGDSVEKNKLLTPTSPEAWAKAAHLAAKFAAAVTPPIIPQCCLLNHFAYIDEVKEAMIAKGGQKNNQIVIILARADMHMRFTWGKSFAPEDHQWKFKDGPGYTEYVDLPISQETRKEMDQLKQILAQKSGTATTPATAATTSAAALAQITNLPGADKRYAKKSDVLACFNYSINNCKLGNNCSRSHHCVKCNKHGHSVWDCNKK